MIGRVVTYIVAIALGMHGVIHLLGLAAAWRLGGVSLISNAPSLGLTSADAALVSFLGVVWALVAVGFILAATGEAFAATWWRRAAAMSAVVSAALCALWWPSAAIGAAVDGVILLCLAFLVLHRPRHLAAPSI